MSTRLRRKPAYVRDWQSAFDSYSMLLHSMKRRITSDFDLHDNVALFVGSGPGPTWSRVRKYELSSHIDHIVSDERTRASLKPAEMLVEFDVDFLPDQGVCLGRDRERQRQDDK